MLSGGLPNRNRFSSTRTYFNVEEFNPAGDKKKKKKCSNKFDIAPVVFASDHKLEMFGHLFYAAIHILRHILSFMLRCLF